jgi:hypothetical protein
VNNAVANPFGDENAQPANRGALAQLERREEAEIMVMMGAARRFPRDERLAAAKIQRAFERFTLASESTYTYSRGGQEISDLNIRAMESIAAAWGNIDASWAEVFRGVGEDGVPYSFVEAKALDLETTNRKRIGFIVRHWRDTKRGGYALKDERDIYELCGNMAQRRVRACIGALIPEDIKAFARETADATMLTKAEVTPDSLKALLEAFEPFGVTKAHIEKFIQRNLESMQPAQLVRMRKIYRGLHIGEAKPGDFFDGFEERAKDAGNTTTLDDIKGKANPPTATPAPSPAPGPAASAPAAATDLAGTPLDGAPKPPEPDALLEKFKKAKNQDALAVHWAWITPANYPDEAVRIRLNEAAEARHQELQK